MDGFLTRYRAALGVGALVVLCAIQPAQAAGDATKGADMFKKKCVICHTAEKDAPNKIGPNLFGVVGRAAGTVSNYSYSTAMKNSGLTWTPDVLIDYLAGPQKKVPGAKMTFAGIADEGQRADVVVYLGTLK